MFENIKEEATRKFCELKFWISDISETDQYSAITRGLFFVYIYGIYEEIIRSVISVTINELNNAHVIIGHCIYEVYEWVF